MIAPEVDRLLRHHQRYHSDLQIDRFIVVRAGGTTYGMFRQALRELDTRLQGLKIDYVEREKIKLRIERAEGHAESAGNGTLENREALLDVAADRLRLDSLERQLADREREFARFYALARALDEQLGELSHEKKRQLDEEFWLHQMKASAALDIVQSGRVTGQTLQSIQALPVPMRAEVMEHLRDRDSAMKLADWWTNYEPAMPDVTPYLPSEREVRAQLCQ